MNRQEIKEFKKAEAKKDKERKKVDKANAKHKAKSEALKNKREKQLEDSLYASVIE